VDKKRKRPHKKSVYQIRKGGISNVLNLFYGEDNLRGTKIEEFERPLRGITLKSLGLRKRDWVRGPVPVIKIASPKVPSSGGYFPNLSLKTRRVIEKSSD